VFSIGDTTVYARLTSFIRGDGEIIVREMCAANIQSDCRKPEKIVGLKLVNVRTLLSAPRRPATRIRFRTYT